MKINGTAATHRRGPPCMLVGMRLVVDGAGNKAWRVAGTWPFDPDGAGGERPAEEWVRRQVADKVGWKLFMQLDVTADALRGVAE